MAILIGNSITPSFTFFNIDLNELNELGTERTVAVVNTDKEYKIKVLDYPINRIWNVTIDGKATETNYKSLGAAISWVENKIIWML